MTSPLVQLNHWTYLLCDALWYRRAYYVLGYPKSGTTWLADLLNGYTGYPWHGRGLSPAGSHRIVHTHRFFPRVDKRTIYLLRDGRDAMISYYTALSRQSSLAAHRQALQRWLPAPFDMQHLCENLPDFIGIIQRQWRSSIPYRRHVLRGLTRCRHVVRYEQLRADPARTLLGALEFLTEGPCDEPRVRAVVEMNSLEHVRKNPRDQHQQEFLGAGVVQGWNRYFTRAAGEAFLRHCGDALIVAGYESDDRWVDHLPVGAPGT